MHTFPTAHVPTLPQAITETSDGGFLMLAYEPHSEVPILSRVARNGSVSVLHVFDGYDMYSGPRGRLVMGADGNYYGTTHSGGDFGLGTVFRIAPDGQFSTVYSFTGGPNGQGPGTRLDGKTDLAVFRPSNGVW
jgi:uncharacterized repeat protein (TIGR03803 family)